MERVNVQSLGGKARAVQLKREALERYYKNPRICKNCTQIIHPFGKRLHDVRIKVFCNHACAASFTNKIRKRKKKEKIIIAKIIPPRFANFILKTKKDLFASNKWQSARTRIRVHAAYVYRQSKKSRLCHECGYDKYFEICHIKAVKDFPPEATIEEINHPDNLIGLCPNHHWEFDNGILPLKSIKSNQLSILI